jgi:hypothetical protein
MSPGKLFQELLGLGSFIEDTDGLFASLSCGEGGSGCVHRYDHGVI